MNTAVLVQIQPYITCYNQPCEYKFDWGKYNSNMHYNLDLYFKTFPSYYTTSHRFYS